jgi:hypothetical protein
MNFLTFLHDANTLISYFISTITANPGTTIVPLALGLAAILCARRYWFREVRLTGRRAAKL